MNGVNAVVSIEIGEGILLVLLTGGFLCRPSRISCLLLKTFMLAYLSVYFKCSNTSLLCKHALKPPSKFDLPVSTFFKQSQRHSFNVSSCMHHLEKPRCRGHTLSSTLHIWYDLSGLFLPFLWNIAQSVCCKCKLTLQIVVPP